MLSSVSKMLERVGEGMAMAVSIAAGDRSLIELEETVSFCEIEMKRDPPEMGERESERERWARSPSVMLAVSFTVSDTS